MGDNSPIEWLIAVQPDGTTTWGATWNPGTGCTKVSPGCKFCYAERQFPRVYGRDRVVVPTPSDGCVGADWIPPETRTGYWTRPRRFTDVKTHPERLTIPVKWKRPRKIFVNSMSDLFHDAIPRAFIVDVFASMAAANWHTFILLTKRADRMREMLNDDAFIEAVMTAAKQQYGVELTLDDWPLRHLWVGVSAEDQDSFDERVRQLMLTPAAVRWVSMEPLLGPVDARPWLHMNTVLNSPADARRLDWVVVGAESGPKARGFDIAWARSIIAQCKVAGVPIFVKQLGARPVNHGQPLSRLRDRKGGDPSEWSADLRVREYPLPRGPNVNTAGAK